jgi:hypothetical protein
MYHAWRKHMAKKKAAKVAAKKSTREALVVASKVKAYIKSKGNMTASETLAALNDKIYCLLDHAVARTAGNRRSTVKPQDL